MQPGLEQRREAVLFKTARLNEYHLAEPGRRWSDVVRHAGAVGRNGLHMGSHCGTDGRPGFFQTSRRGYLVNDYCHSPQLYLPHCFFLCTLRASDTHVLPSSSLVLISTGQQYHDANGLEQSVWAQDGPSVGSATWRVPEAVCPTRRLVPVAPCAVDPRRQLPCTAANQVGEAVLAQPTAGSSQCVLWRAYRGVLCLAGALYAVVDDSCSGGDSSLCLWHYKYGKVNS